jgi:hypothetical protein
MIVSKQSQDGTAEQFHPGYDIGIISASGWLFKKKDI